MRTLSILSLKGGTGKTATAKEFAYILSKMHGYRVLLADNDKQGDLSRQLNRRDYFGEGMEEVLTNRHPVMRNIIKKTDYEGIDIISADMRLINAITQVIIDQQWPQQSRLEKALAQVNTEYDFCIIDNAPNIDMSIINALVASDDIIIPIEIDDNTTDGLPELIQQIENIKDGVNPNINLAGCLITKFNKQNKAHREGVQALRTSNYKIFSTQIRTSLKVAESTFERKAIGEHSRGSAAAVDYRKAAAEYLEKIKSDSDK